MNEKQIRTKFESVKTTQDVKDILSSNPSLEADLVALAQAKGIDLEKRELTDLEIDMIYGGAGIKTNVALALSGLALVGTLTIAASPQSAFATPISCINGIKYATAATPQSASASEMPVDSNQKIEVVAEGSSPTSSCSPGPHFPHQPHYERLSSEATQAQSTTQPSQTQATEDKQQPIHAIKPPI